VDNHKLDLSVRLFCYFLTAGPFETPFTLTDSNVLVFSQRPYDVLCLLKLSVILQDAIVMVHRYPDWTVYSPTSLEA